ncbi:MAG: quinolinate synthase NadA [Phycisphaerae bacterium]|nr:quinolinate synthase NadA [Phycisphaerae bacterium]
MIWQPSLPEDYGRLSDDQLAAGIRRRKAELGDRLVILGHHYQQDDVVKHADFTGDSFKLSQLAAEKVQEVGAEFVVFCGVHFMAESADILTPPGVAVILPDLSAGCSMADMAADDDVVDAWEQIEQALGEADFRGRVIPITYMNSSAAIKAFVGEKGGAVCTSSNARQVLDWAFAGGTRPREAGEQIKIIFLPDQHLGRNTAADMGYDIHRQMCLWDPNARQGLGGNDAAAILASDVILWKGHCSVHKLFRPEHVDEVKARSPQTTVIVHPECMYEVVQKADLSGSTEKICRSIEQAPAGSKWAIGTEVHMVQRLARQHPDKDIRMLSDCQCLCTTMYRIDPQHLLWVLDGLVEGEVRNQVKVDDRTRRWSLEALQRMLDITAAGVGTQDAASMIID